MDYVFDDDFVVKITEHYVLNNEILHKINTIKFNKSFKKECNRA